MTHYNIDESLVISNRLTRNKFVNDPGNYRIRWKGENGTIYRTLADFAITDIETNDDEYIQYLTLAFDEDTSKRYNLNAGNDSGSTYGYKTLATDIVAYTNPSPMATVSPYGAVQYLNKVAIHDELFEFLLLLQRMILKESFPTGKQATAITYSSTSNGTLYQNSQVAFTLTNEDGDGIDEADISATVGDAVIPIETDSGNFTVNLESLDDVPTGEVEITVSFAGDDNYYASTADKTVTVTAKEDTTLSYDGATDGTTYTNTVLEFTLADAEDAGIDAATVTFTVGEETVTATTSSGTATLDLESDIDPVPTGSVTVSASYAGDDDYRPSTASATVTVEYINELVISTTSIVVSDGGGLTVEGIVKDGDDTAVSGATISWTAGGTEQPLNANSDHTTLTDTDGTFTCTYATYLGEAYSQGAPVVITAAKTGYPSDTYQLPAYSP